MNAERPSLIADDPVPTTAPRRGWTRWIGALVAVGVLGGFGAGVGYVYWYVTRAGDGTGTVPLVRADAGPIRVRPENPGGLQVPDQNIDVYNRIGQPAPSATRPQVERLLPPPEPPMPRPPAPVDTRAQPTPPQNGTPRPPLTRDQAQPPPAGPGPVAQAPAPAPTPAPPQPAPQAPRPQQLANAPQPGVIPPGSMRVQLASMGSQDAANAEIQRLRRGQPELLRDLNMVVVRTDLGTRGTFYRVQAGPLRDRAAADQLCAALQQRRLGCQVVQ